MKKQKNSDKPVLLVDNDCKFCSKSVQFIFKHGGENKYHFLSLNSEDGRKILQEYDFPKDYNKSIVLIENEKVYLKSDAALSVAKNLNGIISFFYWFRIVPKKIRDAVYSFVSKHRHKII